MKVFLDTNVWVAAFVTRGLCADLLRAVLARHELVVGEVELSELRGVLARKTGIPSHLVDEIEEFLRTHAVVPRPSAHRALGTARR